MIGFLSKGQPTQSEGGVAGGSQLAAFVAQTWNGGVSWCVSVQIFVPWSKLPEGGWSNGGGSLKLRKEP